MEDEDQILIGEGVVLDSGAAPVTLRMLSGAIDLAILIMAMIGATTVLDRVLGLLNGALQRAVLITVLVAILVALPATVETLSRGRSLGRFAVGLRIVRDDGGPISARHAWTRALVGVFEVVFTLGSVAVTVSILGARGKRIGDYLAGTYAMRTRGAGRALPPLVMPPGMAHWASTADIARLPDGLALTARMFLAGAERMHPPSRVRVGTRLADQVVVHVSPAPPPGTHPEAVIAAVLAERRDREWRLESARMQEAETQGDALRRLPFGIPDAH